MLCLVREDLGLGFGGGLGFGVWGLELGFRVQRLGFRLGLRFRLQGGWGTRAPY